MGGRGSSSGSGRVTHSRGGYTIDDETYHKYVDDLPRSIYNRMGISTKQAGVLYGAYKRGELNATEDQISRMYLYTNRYVYGYSTKSTETVADLSSAVSAVFNHDSNAANYFFQSWVLADEGGY